MIIIRTYLEAIVAGENDFREVAVVKMADGTVKRVVVKAVVE